MKHRRGNDFRHAEEIQVDVTEAGSERNHGSTAIYISTTRL